MKRSWEANGNFETACWRLCQFDSMFEAGISIERYTRELERLRVEDDAASGWLADEQDPLWVLAERGAFSETSGDLGLPWKDERTFFREVYPDAERMGRLLAGRPETLKEYRLRMGARNGAFVRKGGTP